MKIRISSESAETLIAAQQAEIQRLELEIKVLDAETMLMHKMMSSDKSLHQRFIEFMTTPDGVSVLGDYGVDSAIVAKRFDPTD